MHNIRSEIKDCCNDDCTRGLLGSLQILMPNQGSGKHYKRARFPLGRIKQINKNIQCTCEVKPHLFGCRNFVYT